MIDNEKLDGLLADCALGAGADGVDLLVELLAEKDPEVRRRLAEYRKVSDLASRCGPGETVLPPFPREKIAGARHARLARECLKWTTAAAACVVIGVYIGTARQRATTTAGVTEVAFKPQTVELAQPADFWSVDRWKAARQEQLTSDSQSRVEDSWRDVIRAGRG